MIGRQINFFLAGDDQRRLLARIDQAVGCVLICRDDHSPYGARAQFDRASSDWGFAYLCEPSSVEQLLALIRADVADLSKVPVIEFMQPTLEGLTLRRGRFWFAPKYMSAGAWHQKPKEFIDWADRVFRIVRRDLVLHRDGDRIGVEALEMFDAGQLVLTT